MKPHLVAVPLLLLASAVIAEENAARQQQQQHQTRPPGPARQYRLSVPGVGVAGKFRAAPFYETVGSPRVIEYKTQYDVPNYDWTFAGNGITVPQNGSAPRSDYAIGMEGGRMQGGGCFPVDPSVPNTCLQEANASGNLVTVYKARERWTFRVSYIDPSNPSAAEFNVGFDTTGFGGGGDSVWEWERRTPKNHSCFTFYEDVCDTYGFNLNELYNTAQYFRPPCYLILGPGYRGYLFYQYSRYNVTDTIPPGAQEWVPNTAATTTRLAQPGKILFSSDWLLGRGLNALAVSGPGVVNPGVPPDTGYATAAPFIAPGSGTIEVTSYDCGVIPNVAFTIQREFIDGSGGHAHANEPSLDGVSLLDAYDGTTDRNGHWSTTLHAGQIGSTIKYTASTQNLLGRPFTSKPLFVTTGFANLTDSGENDPNIRYTGNTSTTGLRHPSNHNGSPELHAFVRSMAGLYNANADPADQGSLGLNDMSLPVGGVFDLNGDWSPPHARHRFGTDCDIDRSVRRADGSFTLIDTADLGDIVRRELDGKFLLESGGRVHVQVPEYEVGTILLRETR